MRRTLVLSLFLLIGLGCALHSGTRPALDLEGTYQSSGGLGCVVTLELKGDSTFTYRMDSDVGNMETARGSVELVKDRVCFLPASESSLMKDSLLSGPWVPIRWGKRFYLIPEKRMLSFVNSVNDGSEPRSSAIGEFPLRGKDFRRRVVGAPLLPDEWREYLLPTPLQGSLTHILDDKAAEVNLGRKDGLRPGMILWARSGAKGWFTLVVKDATDHTGIVSLDVGEGQLSAGIAVTTHP